MQQESKKIFFSLVTLIVSLFLLSPNCLQEHTWNKSFSSALDQTAHEGRECLDGSFIVIGETASPSHGEKDILLQKLDREGNLVSSEVFGGEGDDIGVAIEKTRRGDYLVGGVSDSWSEGDEDLFLMLVSDVLGIAWMQTYGSGRDDRGYDVMETDDSHILVLGSTRSYSNGKKDVWVLKTDEVGNLKWQQNYGWSGDEEGFAFTETRSGILFATGYSNSMDTETQLLLLKIGNDGNLLQAYTYPETGCVVGRAIAVLRNGDIAIVGDAYRTNTESFDLCVMRVQEDGNLLWYRSVDLGHEEFGYGLSETEDGGVVALGRQDFGERKNVFLQKLDGDGKDVWMRVYDGKYDILAGFSVSKTMQGGFFVTGSMQNAAGDWNLWTMLTDVRGFAPTVTEEAQVNVIGK